MSIKSSLKKMARKTGFSEQEVYSRYNTSKGDLHDTDAALRRNQLYIAEKNQETAVHGGSGEEKTPWYGTVPLLDMNHPTRKKRKRSTSPECIVLDSDNDD